VLPNPDDAPTGIREGGIVGTISPDISLEFGRPESNVGPRVRRVFRTAMPEATVDEYRQPSSREDDVGAYMTSSDLKPEIGSVAKASPM
jgi:hypothetical protein